MIKAVIFDMDGVVINSEPIYNQADNAFLIKHNPSNDLKTVKHLITGTGIRTSTGIMKEKFGLTGTLDELIAERLVIIRGLYKNLEFVPGFLEFFAAIKNKYQTAIATSSDAEMFNIADGILKLKELFNGYIYFLSDVGNVSKPAPDIFLFAAKKLGVNPAECLVIEDAVNGIKAAKSAGMKCVGLASTHHKEMLNEADLAVNNFSEIDLSKF